MLLGGFFFKSSITVIHPSKKKGNKTMRQIGILLLGLAMVFTYSMSTKAELIDRGSGMIYDTDLGITWLQDANYAMTSGYDADGRMTWEQANAWAGQLTYGGYEGWRLPKTLPVNGSTYIYPNQDFYDGSGDIGGYNISAPGSVYAGSKASELSYFYYNSLKNLGAFDLNGNFNPNWSQLQVGPFSGVQISKYWSGTDYDSLTGTAFSFNTDGGQNIDWKYEEHFVWAVRDGDVAASTTINVAPYQDEFVIMAGTEYDQSSGKLSYIPINNDGTFGSVSEVADIGYRAGAGIADFDNDGDLDFVAGAKSDGSSVADFYLFENVGMGNFVQHFIATVNGGDKVGTFAVADFNKDGFKDFVVPIYFSSFIYLFTNNGDNTFTWSLLPPISNPFDAREGDFNEDGNMDFVVSEYFAGHIWLYAGYGNGGFNPSPLFYIPYRAADITSGDFNEDGHLDIIVDDFIIGGGGGHLFVGNGTGNFIPSGMVYTRPVGGASTYGVDSFDFDKDGHRDLILSSYEFEPTGLVFVMKGNGDGTFQPAVQVASGLGSVFPVTPSEIIEDKVPPILTLPDDMVLECNGSQGRAVTFVATAEDDIDGPVAVICTPASGSTFYLGETQVVCTASDKAGNTATQTFTVTINDTTIPNIKNLRANPDVLWPANHKMVTVAVKVDVSDNCDPAPLCRITSVSSNEPENGLGDGDTAPDWKITGKLTANLRAERSGNGNGRIYTLTITCNDTAGNSSSKWVTVKVPHDQGKK